LTFENISYEIRIKCTSQEENLTGKKFIRQKIVKDVSGYALPGETLFIMGASGAGKTSLLNILSDRISLKNGAKIKGKIYINDSVELKGATFGKIASYVM
jgi:ABC-type multidrug transport system ATPase subunit